LAARRPAMPSIGLLAPAFAGQVEIIDAVRQGLKAADFSSEGFADQ